MDADEPGPMWRQEERLSSPPSPKPSAELLKRESPLGILSEHVAPLATGATGLAYIFGVWEVSQVAHGLGISSPDFGLDFRDYALLAAVALLPLLIILVAYPLGLVAHALAVRVGYGLIDRYGYHPINRYTRPLTTAVPYGVVVVLGVLWAMAPDAFDVVLIGILAFMFGYVTETWTRRSMLLRLVALIGLAYLVFSFVLQPIRDSRLWSEDVKEWVATGANSDTAPDAPRGLTMVLGPNLGLARIGPDVECVVKMGDVLIGAETVVVAASLDRFISTTCTPEARPFDD